MPVLEGLARSKHSAAVVAHTIHLPGAGLMAEIAVDAIGVTIDIADGDGGLAARRAALAIVPGVMFAGVAGGIAFPILPMAGLSAGLSLPFIGLILAANRIGRIFASPVVGVLSDRWGGRPKSSNR